MAIQQEDREGMINVILEEIFDDTLLNTVYQKLMEAQVSETEVNKDLVGEGMKALFNGLRARRMDSSDQEWLSFVSICLHHPLCALLHQEPITFRAFKKPRGYAGDAVLIDLIYSREEHWPIPEGTSELGQKIFDFMVGAPAAEAVRARRGRIAEVVDNLADEMPQPHILSVAAGHLREASLSAAVKRRKIGRYVAADADTNSLETVDECYSRYGIEVAAASVRQFLTQRVDLGKFDLVYSTGLFDYVQQAAAQRLAWNMFQMLNPKGKLLVANFHPGIDDIGYMESYMNWHLIYRTRQEMLDVTMNIPQSDIGDIRLFTEENQNIIFLQVTKR